MILDELRERVEQVLDEDIRPAFRAGGGDVELVTVDQDRVAVVRLSGSCGGCPGTTMSIVMGIEQQLREKVPEIAYVEVTSSAE